MFYAMMTWSVLLLVTLLTTGRTALDEGSFWHVTDFHYDFSYEDEAFSCNKPVSRENRGRLGNGWCDSPWSLVNDSVMAMSRIEPDVDFIIWTGDNVLHTKNESFVLSTATNLDMLDNITDALRRAFPNRVTYPAFGNHDYFPDAQFPVTENELYRHMSRSWSVWVNGSSISETFLKGGYYSIMIANTNIRIVSLNTNLYYKSNKLVANITDPSDQFDWLEKLLSAAKTNDEKVVMIAHVPPGIKTPDGFMWFYNDHNTRFNDIIVRHAAVISAIHLGHDHMDEFKIYYDQKGDPLVPMFLAPSVTPWRYVSKTKTDRFRNPGIRLVKYDRQTGRHLDYVQYYLDLQKANLGQATWEKLYEFKTLYKTTDITSSSLHDLREQLLKESSPVQHYFKSMVVNGDVSTQCEKKCRGAIYCGMRFFEQADYDICVAHINSALVVILHYRLLLLTLATIVYTVF